MRRRDGRQRGGRTGGCAHRRGGTGRADPGQPDITGVARGGRRYSQLHVHGISKLVGLLATVELARRLPAGTSP
ncbi:hypothetical protein QMA61_37110 [Streptomyces coelicoflavus]|uniref:hypothetical protein n=1 Tax=Streptomyces TaxID=1883 RepID=UPI0018850C93|nr:MULTISPECIES: hypothetical protein [Streptomyces]MDI6521790.1 hypothetical protein [Streptomyces coelicoflavus]